jgi:hypothetical protein
VKRLSGPEIVNFLKPSGLITAYELTMKHGAPVSKVDDSCDHGDICFDDRVCLDCGKDMTEELSSRAEAAREMREDR